MDIIEYKLERTHKGEVVIPGYVTDGGYWPVGKKLIGIHVDDGTYMPSSIKTLTELELEMRIRDLPLTDGEGGPAMTDQEKKQLASKWIQDKKKQWAS